MGMIDTQNDATRLSAIDGATALGQLADDAVIALSNWLSVRRLSESDASSLRILVSWLDHAAASISDPLGSVLGGRGLHASVGLDNFSIEVTDAALDALAPGKRGETEASAIRDLRDRLAGLLDGRGDSETAEALAATFEAVAKAMLVAADLMLSPAPRTAWTTSLVS